MKEYPKILLININFRTDKSSGITISKLIDHIPARNLFLLSTTADISDIAIFGDKKQLGKSSKFIKEKQNKKSFLRKSFVKIIGRKTIFKKQKLDDEVKKWLDKIKPDYIYFSPDRLVNVEFSNEIASYCNSKIIIHVMDDKVSVNYPGLLGLIYKAKFNRAFKDIVNRASIRLSISDLMAEEYYKRYGQNFNSFHNPVDLIKWLPYQKKEVWQKNNIKIIYSGAVGSSSMPILQFCEAISRLNEQNYNIKFYVYTNYCHNNVRESLKSYSFIQLKDYVSYESVPKTLSQADFLLLPLAFEKEMKFIRLSMSTKTSEYMVTGVPIFVFAPSDTALSQYAQSGNWGHLIIRNDINYISTKIIDLFEDIDLQKKYSRNAIALIIKNHNTESNKKRFDELLMSV